MIDDGEDPGLSLSREIADGEHREGDSRYDDFFNFYTCELLIGICFFKAEGKICEVDKFLLIRWVRYDYLKMQDSCNKLLN